MDLSINGCILSAATQLAAFAEKGWVPKKWPASSSETQLLIRADADTKALFVAGAKSSGVVLTEFIRLAAVACLIATEGRKRVLWPLKFTKSDFIRAGELFAD